MGLLPGWTADQYIALLCCGGEFVLCGIALSRPLSSFIRLTGLLSLNIACWNFAHLAYVVSGQLTWQWLHLSLSPWTPPLTLHLVATFLGKRRSLRRYIIASYVAFGALSWLGFLAFFDERARQMVLGQVWSWAFLGLLAPTTVGVFALLGAHLAEEPKRSVERRRTQLLLAALAIACLGATTDPVLGRGSIPPVVSLGFLTGNVLLLVVALRGRVRKPPPRWITLTLLVAAVGGTLAHLLVFRAYTPRAAVLVIVAIDVAALMLAILVPRGVQRAATRQDWAHWVTLGRHSNQMAHDFAGPLSAVATALDWMLADLEGGGGPTPRQRRMLELMSREVGRSTRLLQRFRERGELLVEATPLDLNALLATQLSLHQLAPKKIEVRMRLCPGPVMTMVDEDLTSAMINNLVRNAVDAMPDGGALTVSSELGEASARGARIRIQDTGKGMNPRVLERVGEEGFTTKPSGSGLGLASARRLMRAQGGSLKITSHEGQGTVVELFFPTGSPGGEGQQT